MRPKTPKITRAADLTESQRSYLVERRTESSPPPSYDRIRTDFYTRFRIHVAEAVLTEFYTAAGLRPAPVGPRAVDRYVPRPKRTLIDDGHGADDRPLAEYLDTARSAIARREGRR